MNARRQVFGFDLATRPTAVLSDVDRAVATNPPVLVRGIAAEPALVHRRIEVDVAPRDRDITARFAQSLVPSHQLATESIFEESITDQIAADAELRKNDQVRTRLFGFVDHAQHR